MKLIKIKKNAVSPLIATILLVAVALSLAGILYSWSSQSAKETTDSVTGTTTRWSECNNIKISFESVCRFNSSAEAGQKLRFLLLDESQITLRDNIIIMAIDANNNNLSTSIAPSFTNKALQVDDTVFDDEENLMGSFTAPIRIRVFIEPCPDQAVSSTCIGN